MAYTDFDATKPDASTQGGTAFGNSANANDTALRDAIIGGQMKGFLYSHTVGTGTAAQPQYFFWKNGTTWLRATNGWNSTGDKAGNLDSQLWEISTNSGSAYSTIDTVACTFDTDGNLTATTGGGSMLTWFLAKLSRLAKVISDLAAHIALTGTSAHGLGSISTQTASAVAITGGAIDGTAIGATTPAAGHFTYMTGSIDTAATPALNAGVTVDWTKDVSTITNSGANVLTFSNIPAAGRMAKRSLVVTAFNSTTFPATVTWGAGGKPSIAGGAWVEMWTTDGGATTVFASVVWY